MQTVSLGDVKTCVLKKLEKKTPKKPQKTVHYENKSIQIHWKFYHQKMKISR